MKGFAVMMVLCAFLAVGCKKPQPVGPQTAATRAVSLCEQAVRQKAIHPASVDFNRFGAQPPTRMKDGSYYDSLDFVEQDKLGDSIAKMAICTVKDGKLLSFREPKP